MSRALEGVWHAHTVPVTASKNVCAADHAACQLERVAHRRREGRRAVRCALPARAASQGHWTGHTNTTAPLCTPAVAVDLTHPARHTVPPARPDEQLQARDLSRADPEVTKRFGKGTHYNLKVGHTALPTRPSPGRTFWTQA